VRLILFSLLVSLYLAVGNAALATASQPDTLAWLGSHLRGNLTLCAEFVQKKVMTALSRPLISKGRLIFLAGQGVLWRVMEPFPAKVLVKETEMIKWDEDGTARRLSYGQSPLFHALTQVFLSMFTGDLSRLETAFVVTPVQTGEDWRLTLSPNDPGFAKFISVIEVGGGRFVEELLISEPSGDKTMIEFINMDVDSCKLGEAEKATFAF
jgi:hypothetical protein